MGDESGGELAEGVEVGACGHQYRILRTKVRALSSNRCLHLWRWRVFERIRMPAPEGEKHTRPRLSITSNAPFGCNTACLGPSPTSNPLNSPTLSNVPD